MKIFFKILYLPLLSLLTACSTMVDSFFINLVPHPQTPRERNYVVKEIEITNPRDGTKIAAELTYPETEKAVPAFVLISGTNGKIPYGKDSEITGHKYFLVISHLLTNRGYAVLRFDNRVVGKSSGDYKNATDDDFASDAAAALEWLRIKSGLNTSAEGYLGHSQGSSKALLASYLENPDYIVSLGRGVLTLEQALLEQNNDINYAIGTKPLIAEKQIEELKVVFGIFRSSKELPEVQEKLYSFAIGSGVVHKQANKFMSIYGTPWWLAEFDRDVSFTSYSGPVLALFGSKDLLVSAKVNEEPTRKSLTHAKLEVHTFEGLNHLFQKTVKGTGPYEYWGIETTIEELVIDKIDKWTQSIVAQQSLQN